MGHCLTGDEARSLSNFSVATETLDLSSAKVHTRRTEALYLEASLRAARKVCETSALAWRLVIRIISSFFSFVLQQAMCEAYANNGHTFQPSVKVTRWSQPNSLSNVVSRLYDPTAMSAKKAEKEKKQVEHELRAFTGKPEIKVKKVH